MIVLAFPDWITAAACGFVAFAGLMIIIATRVTWRTVERGRAKLRADREQLAAERCAWAVLCQASVAFQDALIAEGYEGAVGSSRVQAAIVEAETAQVLFEQVRRGRDTPAGDSVRT